MELTSTLQSKSSEVQPQVPPRPHVSPLRFVTYDDKECIQKLTYLIVRPPRLKYDPEVYLKNPRPATHTMVTYSIPFDLTVYAPNQPCRYCILYLHGNSSCRLEGMNMVKEIPEDVGLACFDFEGCGNGKQEFITLGIKESKQANVAAHFLQQKGYKVVGWGRSMGAASLLLSNINVMVVDSAFCSIKDICSSVAQKQVKWMPSCLFYCLFSCVFCCVSCDFKKKTSQQIKNLSILEHIKADSIGRSKSAMFISGDEDMAIDCSHSRRLYEDFKGSKQLLIFAGTHNSTRPTNILNKCFQFINSSLAVQLLTQETSFQELKVPPNAETLIQSQPAISYTEN